MDLTFGDGVQIIQNQNGALFEIGEVIHQVYEQILHQR